MTDFPNSVERFAFMSPGERLKTVVYDKLQQYRLETEAIEDQSMSSLFLELEESGNPLTLGVHTVYGSGGFIDSQEVVNIWLEAPEGVIQYVVTGEFMEDPRVVKLISSQEVVDAVDSEINELTLGIENAVFPNTRP